MEKFHYVIYIILVSCIFYTTFYYASYIDSAVNTRKYVYKLCTYIAVGMHLEAHEWS